MIGTEYCIGTGSDGHPRIVRIENALHDQLAGPECAHPFESPEIERGIELTLHQLGHFADVSRLHLSRIIAEAPALGMQHRECPPRIADDAPDIGWSEPRRHPEAIADV